MKLNKVNIEGLEIQIENNSVDDDNAKQRMSAYCFRYIREQSGMSRTEFSQWLNIPYRTMQEWELGRRSMPDYVLHLIAYKVVNEKKNGHI